MGMGAMAKAIMARPPSDQDKGHSIRQASWIPMTEEIQAAFLERFGVRVVSEVYGQSECWPATLGVMGAQRRYASVGKVVPGMQVRLVGADDTEVPVGEIGEIAVRSEHPHRMFLGYWNNPQATAEAFRDGWHHTGDNGRFDEDGFLYFIDRKKDSLRRRGENVSSIELELAIMQHPNIVHAAVHAVPSELTEDDIKVCIVPAKGATPALDDLFEFFKKNVPYYAMPRYVEFVDALPTNVNGRVQKFILRERGITPDTFDLVALGLVVSKSERRT
jgi:crotonobetaine/carnitine-CoA ligase